MRVNHCVCFETTFAELKKLAEDEDEPTIETLQRHHPFGTNCGLCVPYVRRMLRTGETVFSVPLTPGPEVVDDAS